VKVTTAPHRGSVAHAETSASGSGSGPTCTQLSPFGAVMWDM